MGGGISFARFFSLALSCRMRRLELKEALAMTSAARS